MPAPANVVVCALDVQHNTTMACAMYIAGLRYVQRACMPRILTRSHVMHVHSQSATRAKRRKRSRACHMYKAPARAWTILLSQCNPWRERSIKWKRSQKIGDQVRIMIITGVGDDDNHNNSHARRRIPAFRDVSET